MTDIEERCKSEFDDDSDNEGIAYAFDPKAGFEYCIFMAHGLKKENAEIKAKISQMEVDHDHATCEYQRQLRDVNASLVHVKGIYRDLNMSYQELYAENTDLKDKNKQLTDRVSSLAEENDQVKLRLAILEEKNKHLCDRLASLEAMDK